MKTWLTPAVRAAVAVALLGLALLLDARIVREACQLVVPVPGALAPEVLAPSGSSS